MYTAALLLYIMRFLADTHAISSGGVDPRQGLVVAHGQECLPYGPGEQQSNQVTSCSTSGPETSSERKLEVTIMLSMM